MRCVVLCCGVTFLLHLNVLICDVLCCCLVARDVLMLFWCACCCVLSRLLLCVFRCVAVFYVALTCKISRCFVSLIA